MFILTGISPEQNMATVIDTTDGVNEPVCLSTLAYNIRQGALHVKGINTKGVGTPLPAYGIYINTTEAQNSLIKYNNKLMNVM
jgi:predicted amino acid racemase